MTIYLSLSHWRYNHHPHRDRYNILLSLRRKRDTSPNLNLNPRIPKHLQTRISKQSHPALHKGQQALKYSYISLRPGFQQKISAEHKMEIPYIHFLPNDGAIQEHPSQNRNTSTILILINLLCILYNVVYLKIY